MSDPLRTDSSRAPGAAEPDRDAKIEQLLLGGLDHYFAAEYEQAINVWTRALFLDRNHARARAYIERARSALAERQRQSEELLQHGVAAFHRGEGDEARRLLEAAMHGGAPSDQALAMLDRLNRLEGGGAAAATAPPAAAARSLLRPRLGRTFVGGRSRRVTWLAAGSAIATIAMLAAATLRPGWPSLLRRPPARALTTAPVRSDAPLPLPRRGETAFARAQQLAAGGHLHDALDALAVIRPTDPQKADADRLRAEIQRQLIELAAPRPVAAAPGTGQLP
jgi:tetratricopeptide (TPR) repeat protein